MSDMIVREDDLEFTDVQSMVAAYEKVKLWLDTIRAMKVRLEERMGPAFATFGVTEVPISDTKKLIHAKEKREKWLTEKVYDLFGFEPQHRSVLEANPGFRKKSIETLLGEEIVYQKKGETKENALIEVEYKDTYKIAELDDKFLPKKKKEITP